MSQGNKKFEDLFNLPNVADLTEDTESVLPTEEEKLPVTIHALEELDKIESALPAVRGLEAADGEMDEIAAQAMATYKDLVDLGMQVEARQAGEVLSVAATFMGHAITAKTAKMNKKLKMIELQLKKAKLDLDKGEGSEQGEGKLIDRNELLAEIKKSLG